MNETLNSITTYFKGVRTEWGKISWPEKRQVVFETLL
jgi:preprotein translocase SecE subunit